MRPPLHRYTVDGNPAKYIKSRYNDDIIKSLLELHWSDLGRLWKIRAIRERILV